MMEPDALHELARLIEKTSGNVVPPGHFPFLRQVATRRAGTLGIAGVEAYVRALGQGALADEWRALLPLITVKESFLFRTPQQFAALTAQCLPELLRARAGSRRLRIWSAGCARGEEPATLAIVLAEDDALAGWDWRIDATDVDEEALAVANRGVFNARAVAQVPEHLLRRYFERRADLYELSPHLASRISFRPLNLVREPFPVPSEPFDLIFLRNVLIYFRPESQRRVVAGIARALAPDGALFLGPSETLWQISDQLDAVDLGDCFCYRPRGPAGPTGREDRRSGHGRPARVERDSARSSPPSPPLAAPRCPADGRPAPTASRDAGTAATAQPAGMPRGTREHLVLAGDRIRDNRLADAAELIEEALQHDPSDPDVHAVEGFLHDLSGRSQLAIASYRAALFLEPGLFQARLLLADCLRRLGWETRAHNEYREVLATATADRGRELAVTAALPLPNREQAVRLARQALATGSGVSARSQDSL